MYGTPDGGDPAETALGNVTDPTGMGTDDPDGEEGGPGLPAGSGGTPPDEPAATDAIGPEYSFDTSGGTKHIEYANVDAAFGGVDSRYYTTNFEELPPPGAVGWRMESEKPVIEGLDIPAPKMEFSTTRKIGALSLAFIDALSALTGTVNKYRFYSFAAGELLFLGASGTCKSLDDGWTVTWKFARAKNRVGTVEVPIIITKRPNGAPDLALTSECKGWDRLEVYRRETKDTTSGRQTLDPYAYAIHRVFEFADFRKLGL